MSDPRPRFGWCDNLDLDPQHITEKKVNKGDTYVVVIPLPYASPKLRKAARIVASSIQGL